MHAKLYYADMSKGIYFGSGIGYALIDESDNEAHLVSPRIHLLPPENYKLIAEFDVDAGGRSARLVCEQFFHGFNAGSGMEMDAFRELDVRSMSMGDLIEIDGVFYICDSIGWKQIESPFQKSEGK